MTERPADVLIIGAGASGGIAARRLVEEGFSVVCLEQGDWHENADYPGDKPNWELVAGKEWHPDPNIRRWPSDYPVDVSDSDMGVLNFTGVGGGTVHYGGIWSRLLPSNFETHTRDGVGDDWPISYEELLPFYERTDRQIGVSGLGGNPAYPPGADPPLPPLPVGPGHLRVARAHARLGWHWWPDSNAILSRAYDGRRPCVQRGTCLTGCNEGAKASVDNTHWRPAVAGGLHLITNARATSIVLDQRGLAAGAEWVDNDGRQHFQPADMVICAANGMGTSRLLLASACAQFRDGLANRSGLVGRRVMMHPLGVVRGSFDESLDSWQGPNGSSIQCLEFYETHPDRPFIRGARWSIAPGGGPLRHAYGTWGEAHHRHVEETFGRTLMWVIQGEDLPDERNRVELSTVMEDSSGMPAPKLVYRIDENSDRILDWNIERAKESFEEAGAVRTDSFTPGPNNAVYLGTARMGDDPEQSVVDRWCVSHDVKNLAVIDGSVFVTAGAGNPTSTICALALRAAEHLIETRKSIPTPERRTTMVHFANTSFKAREVPEVEHVELTEQHRSRLVRLADSLIPASDRMPSAGSVVADPVLLDRVMAARPDLGSDLERALSSDFDEPDRRLADLKQSDQPGYTAVTTVVAGGYYLDESVRQLIGYPGQEARPVRPDAFPEYVAEGLLDHLVH